MMQAISDEMQRNVTTPMWQFLLTGCIIYWLTRAMIKTLEHLWGKK